MSNSGPLFSIFTPTYNRARTLPRLYDSLVAQSFREFEWIIIDDGSLDGTGDLVYRLAAKGCVKIKYLWKENEGKHRAYNQAIEMAEGALFVTLDSDDWFSPDALEKARKTWLSVSSQRPGEFAGIRTLSRDKLGLVIGNGFPFGHIDGRIYEINSKYAVFGDKCNFVVTEIARKFPFPVFPNERFCPEGLVWNRISREYLFRHINEPVQIVEYQPDGLSSKSAEIRMKSPRGSRLYYREASMLRGISFSAKIRSLINYIRYSVHAREWPSRPSDGIKFIAITVPLLPFGFFLYVKDRITAKNNP